MNNDTSRRLSMLFLPVHDRNSASSRYRMYQFLPWFEKYGHECTVMTPVTDLGQGLMRLLKRPFEHRRILRAAKDMDVVFIQKRLLDGNIVRKLKSGSRRLVYDYDDSIYMSSTGGWSASTRAKIRSRFTSVMKSADVVITGNAFLREKAIEAGAGSVEVVPTAIDLDKYRIKTHKEGPVTLGWIGSSVNHRYIDMLSGVLPELARRHDGLRLLVVSDKDYQMDGIEVENRRWSEESEVDDLLDMDIGLMPLEDNEWTKGKCALKALQYMACGIPPVCSDVGANIEVLRGWADEYLVNSTEEWVEKIGMLIADYRTREATGMAGRVTVEKGYSLSATAERLIEILKSI